MVWEGRGGGVGGGPTRMESRKTKKGGSRAGGDVVQQLRPLQASEEHKTSTRTHTKTSTHTNTHTQHTHKHLLRGELCDDVPEHEEDGIVGARETVVAEGGGVGGWGFGG
jgi:hypothetical protein